MQSLEHSRRVVEQSLLRLKWLAAAANFELAMRRHARALKYSPDQPRVPAGSPDGGQWTDAGGGGGQGSGAGNGRGRNDPRVISDITPDNTWKPGEQYAQNEPRNNPVINRHIVDNHVGKTDIELIERIHREQFPGLFATVGRDRMGSFDSAESAGDFIRRTVENNPDAVARVVSGQSDEEFLTWRFGYETGREAILDVETGSIRIRKTYDVGVVIRHDPSSKSGYRVVTAYPRNYNPRIGR